MSQPRSIVHAWIAGFLLFSVAVAALAAGPTDGAPAATATDEFFGPTKVWSLHLEISAEEYEAMQPKGGFAFPGAPAPPAPPPESTPQGKPRDSERNLFGMEFPWARASLSSAGATYGNVGLRYAGDGTYFASAFGLKRPLKVDLARFDDQQFHGLKALHLHSGALDATKGRETVAYEVFRLAGVPAPRTAYAEVTLTVPGRYENEYLGLFTLVEDVDARFLADRFHTDRGLLLRPQRMRGLDYLGDDWQKYRDQYQPQTEAAPEQALRVIEFARLINEADDATFRREIGSFLDVDQFLRFMASSALLANLDGFLSLGHNYHLYLHPETNQFTFMPGELELALANFLMMGSAEQLMDLSLVRPYPGSNRLAERLLADEATQARYLHIVKHLSADVFGEARLLGEIETIEQTTKEPLAREAKAEEARAANAPPGPGAGFGPPGGFFPQPPDLRTFVKARRQSMADQLAGASQGYVPQFNFGPPPQGGAANEPLDDATVHDVVQAPDEFEVTLYAAPPDVGYPVAVSASPTGELFVAVDEQGSLGRTPGGGKLLRCLDTDGDGKADQINVFAKMEHPRGVVYHGGSAWVLHPPLLSVFHDDDRDGTSDRQETLVTGLTTDLIDTRGGDHTTNGIRLGVDGWLYIAVGDYGIREARGNDGVTLSLRGGGILRVRPDGTELEIFATGLRNPFDIGIDSRLDLFTRDNTNDGGGWDVRVSHLVQTGVYGYTQLFANFPDEIVPPLGMFGGGGGTGVLFLQDPNWPGPYRDTLYTGDWGRSEVYRHALSDQGASFQLQQEVFLKIPRPTGMDSDGHGRLYVASWRGGEASVFIGPQVGFLARVAPKGLAPTPYTDLRQAGLDRLLADLGGENAVFRLHSQREILRRGRSESTSRALAGLAADGTAPLAGRIAALFALKQLDGAESHPALLKLAGDPALREFALRALTDRRGELAGVTAAPFVAALADESPRVRAQALISLGRLNDPSAAASIVPLTARPDGSAMPAQAPVHAQPDPDRVVPHLAVRALVSLRAVEECLAALDGPYRQGALQALRCLHDERAVEGLIKKLAATVSTEQRLELLATLIRLYHREADYDGTWWGIRPDNTGPYYDGRPWQMSERIAGVIVNASLDGDAETVKFLNAQLARHQVRLEGLPSASEPAAPAEAEQPIALPLADPADPNQIGNLALEAAAARTLRATGDVQRGKLLFTSHACRVCHTDVDGQTPKGPHLVNIGKRYTAAELVESILKPSAKLAQGFETNVFQTVNGLQYSGFVVGESAAAIRIRDLTGVQHILPRDEIEVRERVLQSAMPAGVVNDLQPEQLADLIAYLQSLE